MKLRNISIIANILLLSQLRLRSEGKGPSWYRTPKGLLGINILVFVSCFSLLYIIMGYIPEELMVWLYPLAVQILSLLPLVTLSFMVLYGIIFVIGESAQYASSEMVNYMPITTTEYVLGSSLSTIFMYLFILMGALGFSLAISIPLGFLSIWAVTALLSIYFMIVGGFVAEIIRALVNRVSSTFSKRGGRSAILTRAVLIVIVLAVSQIFFNPNILLRVIQWFAPQVQALWYVPLLWPSVVVLSMSTGDVAHAIIYCLSTVVFGLFLMGLGVFLRSRYWLPVPVTVKLGSVKVGAYGGRGILGTLGLNQGEAALARKDVRSLIRRKEMVRYLAIPVIILIPMLLSITSETDPTIQFSIIAMMCLIGGGMFGLFISMISIGQEGGAIWNILSSPLASSSIFRSKLLVSSLVSLFPAIVLPIAVSLIFGFTPNASIILIVVSSTFCLMAVMIGSSLAPKYMDLEERPRNTYIRGTGILLGFVILGVAGVVAMSPLFLYVFFRETALSLGITSMYALLASVVIAAIFIFVFYHLASRSMRGIFVE